MFTSVFFSTLIGVALVTPALGQISSGCPSNGPISCQNTTAVSNLCCFESPGGLILQTQFWDTNPSTGPTNSWTIHGLWPDNCDSTFEESCDSSRDYTGIGTLLSDNGETATLDYMQTYWLNDDGTSEELWEHEWATHGTCYSTLEPSCFSNYYTGEEAVAFFVTAVNLFQTLPTYTFLANAGITPSSSATYTLAQVNAALKAGAGVTPALQCSGSKITAIYWFFNLEGSIVDGTFEPINAPAADASTCPSKGLSYPPKS